MLTIDFEKGLDFVNCYFLTKTLHSKFLGSDSLTRGCLKCSIPTWQAVL